MAIKTPPLWLRESTSGRGLNSNQERQFELQGEIIGQLNC